jgi:TatD DNase family protein
MKGRYLDSHFHLEDKRFAEDREEVLKRAIKEGLWYLLTPIDISDNENERDAIITVAQKYDNYFLGFGVHPHTAKYYSDKIEKELIELIKTENMVAIGEIGLDYYYDFSDRETQKTVFKRQLEIAAEYNLPVIVHIRDAFDDAEKILFDNSIRGVLHSYTGDKEFALEGIKQGFFISYSGILTFKKAEDIKESFLNTPLDRLLFETDSPYLAPVPLRGKRNEPSFVKHIYKRGSELKSIDEEIIKKSVEENFEKLFLKKG